MKRHYNYFRYLQKWDFRDYVIMDRQYINPENVTNQLRFQLTSKITELN